MPTKNREAVERGLTACVTVSALCPPPTLPAVLPLTVVSAFPRCTPPLKLLFRTTKLPTMWRKTALLQNPPLMQVRKPWASIGVLPRNSLTATLFTSAPSSMCGPLVGPVVVGPVLVPGVGPVLLVIVGLVSVRVRMVTRECSTGNLGPGGMGLGGQFSGWCIEVELWLCFVVVVGLARC